ncbi:MAG: electron transfer flavoprotein subunit beta/FixA family protein [Chitinivibrionales bacterium]|nr:electron transfer flavoprotein subunit beta/FixA family protein [Chitinivibrionales bacterium]
MNIVVCIKQVPGSTQVKINPETGTLMRDTVEAIINPFDEYALEEGIRLKEKVGGIVTVVTMGPPQAETALRDAMALGADEGCLITDRAFAGSDTWATSYTLSEGIRKIGPFDLIICGKQAIDGDTAQVGPGVAEMLNVPFVAWVKKIREISSNGLEVERMMEDGYDVVRLGLPCLITVVKEINTPRMASLKGKMRAKKAQIRKITVADLPVDKDKLGLKGSPTQVLRSFVPQRKTGGEKVFGEAAELAQRCVTTITDLGVIK